MEHEFEKWFRNNEDNKKRLKNLIKRIEEAKKDVLKKAKKKLMDRYPPNQKRSSREQKMIYYLDDRVGNNLDIFNVVLFMLKAIAERKLEQLEKS